MYVLVMYRNDYTGNYGGRQYVYKTWMPLVPGDIVVAPTWKGDAPAKVFAIEIPEESISPDILPGVREITEYYLEDDE